mmetsp:Transcript_13418/g.46766  ORF Transcript_13418/g.46766 Transcript_13418/m.46766 type:complete len:219 (-) Transcript_13418:1064-1720(-)
MSRVYGNLLLLLHSLLSLHLLGEGRMITSVVFILVLFLPCSLCSLLLIVFAPSPASFLIAQSLSFHGELQLRLFQRHFLLLQRPLKSLVQQVRRLRLVHLILLLHLLPLQLKFEARDLNLKRRPPPSDALQLPAGLLELARRLQLGPLRLFELAFKRVHLLLPHLVQLSLSSEVCSGCLFELLGRKDMSLGCRHHLSLSRMELLVELVDVLLHQEHAI